MLNLWPAVYRVSLAEINDADRAQQADARAQAIMAAVGRAAERIGGQPTHVIADRNLLFNMEAVEANGLSVLRRARERANRLTVDLARANGEE